MHATRTTDPDRPPAEYETRRELLLALLARRRNRTLAELAAAGFTMVDLIHLGKEDQADETTTAAMAG